MARRQFGPGEIVLGALDLGVSPQTVTAFSAAHRAPARAVDVLLRRLP